MQTAPEVLEVEQLAKTANVPISRALMRAGVSLSTYWRWRKGSEPKGSTLRKVKAAISEIAEAA